MHHLNRHYFQRFFDDAHYQPMLGELMVRSHWNTFKAVFFLGDTTTIRAVLMIASIWQAVAFMVSPWQMGRPFYSEMQIFPPWAWAAAFMLHAVLVWWRFRDHRNREVLGFTINLYGFLLWSFMCALETMRAAGFSAAMGMEWTVISAAFGALIRTGDKQDRTSA